MNTQITFSTSDDILADLPNILHREELEQCGVEFDENGQPVWYTMEEWIDELDRKLVDHFGDEYRILANKRRIRWNRSGTDFSRTYHQ